MQALPHIDVPAILCGDFNAMPDSNEIRALRGSAAPLSEDVVFMDAWDFADGGGPGYTWTIENPNAARHFHGNARLDYIFVRYTPESEVGSIHGTRTFGGPEDGWPSDHLGVVADIAVH